MDEPTKKQSFNIRPGRLAAVTIPPSTAPVTILIDPNAIDGQMFVVLPLDAKLGHQAIEEGTPDTTKPIAGCDLDPIGEQTQE